MNPWDDQEDYPPSDWQDEVENGDTRLGYVEWVQEQRDLAEDGTSGQNRESYTDDQDRDAYTQETCADGHHRPDDDPTPGDRCKDCRRQLTWRGPGPNDWDVA